MKQVYFTKQIRKYNRKSSAITIACRDAHGAVSNDTEAAVRVQYNTYILTLRSRFFVEISEGSVK